MTVTTGRCLQPSPPMQVACRDFVVFSSKFHNLPGRRQGSADQTLRLATQWSRSSILAGAFGLVAGKFRKKLPVLP